MEKFQNFSPQDLFFNRELSWIAFNERVLEEAINKETPLLERLKFLSIFNSNLDEFFMVRVAGLKKMQKDGFVSCETPDRSPISDVLDQIKKKVDHLLDKFYHCLFDVLHLLKKEGLLVLSLKDLSHEEQKFLHHYFHNHVFPILTPLAVDSSHPYPFLSNLAIYLAIEFEHKNAQKQNYLTGFVEVPLVLPRLIEIPNKKFVLLEDLIANHIEELFLGFSVKSFFPVRVTRNLDYSLETGVVDLLDSIQKAVIHRQHQEAVRLEIGEPSSENLVSDMISMLKIDKNKDVYKIKKPVFVPGLMDLYKHDLPHLKENSFNPRIPARLSENQSIFTVIKYGDLLVHHPYESFYAVTEFLGEAANDPQVLAIKQTLYRTSGDSPIIESLIKAAENGKHVTAVVELKARFDEKNNILWARRLERAGVNVVYGFVGIKTHCKATLVVRRENNDLIKYVHLSTGNYNSQTAKFYSDLGLFSSNQLIGQDIASLFNILTGFNILNESGQVRTDAILPKFEKIIISPIHLKSWLINQLDELIQWNQKNPGTAKLTAKINGLVDQKIIHKLYEASQHGVLIHLIVRGTCALRPKVPGLSENITVRSIIDRFLEHSRIYHFQMGKEDKVYLASADWLTRSFSKRIEAVFPVEDKSIKHRLIHEILFFSWNDNQKSRELSSDGSYVAIKHHNQEEKIRSQEKFISLARQGGVKSIPYEKAIQSYKGKRKSVRSPLGEKK